MRVLVVNAGSSSLKLRLLDEDDTLLFAEDRCSRTRTVRPGVRRVPSISSMSYQIDAVGHRVVHGGTQVHRIRGHRRHRRSRTAGAHRAGPPSSAKVPGGNRFGATNYSQTFLPLPASTRPSTPTMPDEATTYAVPEDWRDRLGVRRFGFHGLSHEYASRRAADLIGRPVEALRIVTCHLGAGASLAAVVNGSIG